MTGELLRMSYKDFPNGIHFAVITSGGHPVIDPDTPHTVLAHAYVRDLEDAKGWFDRMLVECPWETRS